MSGLDLINSLQCGSVKALAYSPEAYAGLIIMESGVCVDGPAAIKLFTLIDSKVSFIVTIAGNKVDTCYFPAKSSRTGWGCWVPSHGYAPPNLSTEEIASIKELYNLARSDGVLSALVTLPEIPMVEQMK